jgi:hypothetical protein
LQAAQKFQQISLALIITFGFLTLHVLFRPFGESKLNL